MTAEEKTCPQFERRHLDAFALASIITEVIVTSLSSSTLTLRLSEASWMYVNVSAVFTTAVWVRTYSRAFCRF